MDRDVLSSGATLSSQALQNLGFMDGPDPMEERDPSIGPANQRLASPRTTRLLWWGLERKLASRHTVRLETLI